MAPLCIQHRRGSQDWSKEFDVSVDENKQLLRLARGGSTVVTGVPGGRVGVYDHSSIIFQTTLLKGHGSCVTALATDQDASKIVSGGDDNAVILWSRICCSWKLKRLGRHKSEISSVAISEIGGAVISGSTDGCVIIWDISAAESIPDVMKDEDGYSITALAINSDGSVAVVCDANFRLTDWKKFEGVWFRGRIFLHSSPITSVSICKEGQLIASGDATGKVAIVEDVDDSRHRRVLEEFGAPVMDITIHSSGLEIAVASADCGYRIWKKRGVFWRNTLVGWHKNPVRSIAFNVEENDGLVSASIGSTVKSASQSKSEAFV